MNVVSTSLINFATPIAQVTVIVIKPTKFHTTRVSITFYVFQVVVPGEVIRSFFNMTKISLLWVSASRFRSNMGAFHSGNRTQVRASQLTFVCSKSTIETLEKSVNVLKVNNKNIRTMSMLLFCVFIVNLELISHLFLVFLLFILNK